ncbi:MFS transporter [Paenibacillus lutrae]|uniref:MFS transporter n=1 Tax=Paenibacillus lutrae TaxID=2078573 RepID=A0A7X3FFX7_9BACL|nr:MFS transporter [Paenibacillus lutrae]
MHLKTRSWHRFTPTRKHLWFATLEGAPATVITTLLNGPFLTGYLLYLGATSSEVGLVLAMTTIVNVGQILMAYLMQKWSNRKLLILIFGSMHRILWACTGLIPFVLERDLWIPAYVVLYTLAFLSNSFAGVVWSTLMADMVPASVRARHFGIRNMLLNALGSLGLFIGGQILDHYGNETGFPILYSIVGVAVVCNVLGYTLYPNPPFQQSENTKLMPMLTRPFKDRTYIRATAFLALWLFMQGISVPLFSYVMLKPLQVSYQTISILTVLQTAVMMMSFYVWGNLNARWSNRQLLFWTLPLLSLSCMLWGLLAWLPVLPVLIMVHMCLGAGTGGFNQLAFNFIIGDTPRGERPMFIAMYSTLTGFAAFLGPLLGGRMYGWAERMPLWVQQYGISSGMGFIMLLLAVSLGRKVLLDKAPKSPPGPGIETSVS